MLYVCRHLSESLGNIHRRPHLLPNSLNERLKKVTLIIQSSHTHIIQSSHTLYKDPTHYIKLPHNRRNVLEELEELEVLQELQELQGLQELKQLQEPQDLQERQELQESQEPQDYLEVRRQHNRTP